MGNAINTSIIKDKIQIQEMFLISISNNDENAITVPYINTQIYNNTLFKNFFILSIFSQK